MTEISASLLAADWAALGEDCHRADLAGVDSFHVDVMDGHYVPNLALTPHHVTALRRYTRRPFSIHLELSNPDEILSCFRFAPGDVVIVQLDTLVHPQETFAKIRAQGAQVGLGLNPDSSLDALPDLLPELDLVLILGVMPGFGGQMMDRCTPERIAAARAMIVAARLPVRIAVDGGVNLENAARLVRSGADVLIAGTLLFSSADMGAVIRTLR
jgi:ribulose-phosphate 3-epimerase